MGVTEIDGFLVDCGWGTYGFKAAPITGVTLAELIATGKTPELIEPFKLERFYTDTTYLAPFFTCVLHRRDLGNGPQQQQA